MALPRHPETRHQAGFTLVELIMVIVIVGALAAVVLPRALDLAEWRLRGFGDELRAQAMATQRLAMVQRRPVVLTLTPTGASIDYVAGGNLASLPCPAGASPCIAEPGTRSVTFNAANSGSALTSTGGALPVTVAYGGFSRSYQIESETGLFRALP